MTPVEAELSRVLDEAAPEPPEGSGPHEFRAPPRRRWVLPAAAAAAVLVVAGITVAISRSGSHGSQATGTDVTTPAPAPNAPAGMISVGYYGITVTVPKSFAVAPIACFAPTRNTVAPDTGEAYSCPAMLGHPKPPLVTLVYLQPSSAGTDQVRATRPTTVDGVAARTGDGFDSNHRPESVLVIPRNQVVVVAIAKTHAAAHRILDTVRFAPVDAHGCADRAERLTGDTNPPATVIVPGHPTSAIACEYSNRYRLVGSGPLTAKQTSRVQRVLDRDRSGSQYAASVLNVRYEFHYADGATRAVDVNLDVDPSAATDGSHVVTASYADLPRAYR